MYGQAELELILVDFLRHSTFFSVFSFISGTMGPRDNIGQIRGDHSRPRRPNPDTIAYLKSLPVDVAAAHQEIQQYLRNNDSSSEYPPLLAAALSALDEIKSEVASLAGDEHAAQVIERLAQVAVPYSELAARMLLFATAGYAVHLSAHRYGSHVLQTIVQLSVKEESKEDLALHQDAPTINQQGLPSLVELMVTLCEEVMPFIEQLSQHICGSHVLRTLLCSLGGLEMMQFGRNQNHRGKSKKKSQGSTNTGMEVMKYVHKPRISCSESSINAALQGLAEAISGTEVKEPGYLQELACHESGSPLLMVLLRVLTYSINPDDWKEKLEKFESDKRFADFHLLLPQLEPNFIPGSPAEALAQRILCWQPHSAEQQWAGDVIYGLASEGRGSHVLETILRLSPKEFWMQIVEKGEFLSSKNLGEYVEHNVSNFVIQTLISTTHDASSTEDVIKALVPLIQSGLIIDPTKNRLGVLWRAVESSAKHGACQEMLLSEIAKGFSSLEKETLNFSKCIPKLLDIKQPEKEGDRITLNVAGTRTVYHLLRFRPSLCEDSLKGVTSLSQSDLEMLAKDPLGSRCIWDGVLEGPRQDICFSKAIKLLLSKMKGKWLALASDRVAHHSVKKIFSALQSMDEREELVKELSQSTNRLNGTAMGRSVMETCAVDDYLSRGSAEWRKKINKNVKKEGFLKGIMEGELSVPMEKAEKHPKRKSAPEGDANAKKVKTALRDSTMTMKSIMTVITTSKEKSS